VRREGVIKTGKEKKLRMTPAFRIDGATGWCHEF
jgi:hypothetical protein